MEAQLNMWEYIYKTIKKSPNVRIYERSKTYNEILFGKNNNLIGKKNKFIDFIKIKNKNSQIIQNINNNGLKTLNKAEKDLKKKRNL